MIINKGELILNTVVIYGTKYGATKKCVDELCSKLEGEYKLVEISEANKKTIQEVDKVIIVTPIYIGAFYKKIKKYCKKYMDILLKKDVYIMMCCSTKDEWLLGGYIIKNTNDKFFKHLKKFMSVGGVLNYDNLSKIEKKLIDLVLKKGNNNNRQELKYMNNIESDRIQEFANIVNGSL